jgi:hypothetical protein
MKNRRHKPLSFRAWEAIGKLRSGLDYKTPRGFPQKHVVLRRDLAAAVLRTIERNYDRSGKWR